MRTFLLMIALIMMTVGKIATIDTSPPPEEDKVYQESISEEVGVLVSSDEQIHFIQANSQKLTANSQSPVRARVMSTVYRQLIYEAHPRTDKKMDPGSCSDNTGEIDKKDFLV